MFGEKIEQGVFGAGMIPLSCDGCGVSLGNKKPEDVPPEPKRSQTEHFCMACDMYRED